jgi:threonylcarbamoyladenosine tRNA methylthiotransferase MtaB
MPSCFIQNFGCRVNQAEAFSWADDFERGGMRLEEDPARADWVIINSCTLTAKADRDVLKFIRRISRINPGAKLVVAGCAVESGTVQSERLGPDVVFLSNIDKEELPQRVLSDTSSRSSAGGPTFRSRAPLKVQDGCDLRCSFCVIPSVRGRSRSVSQEDVLARARELVVRGFREIVVCGIHLSSYGVDLEPRDSLAGLLEKLLKVEGLGKLRLSSLDPRSLNEPLIGLIAGASRVCPHFHLSLQHASDRILKRMGRGSLSASYGRILAKLRRDSPSAALGADIIVGFPGETEADFEEMRDFLAASPLDYLHVFGYSSRPGTPAADWIQVGETEKRRRSRVLRKLSAEKRRAFRLRFLGEELEAIVIRKKGASFQLLTSNYIDVQVPACSAPPGGEAKVRITRVEPEWTEGEVVA